MLRDVWGWALAAILKNEVQKFLAAIKNVMKS